GVRQPRREVAEQRECQVAGTALLSVDVAVAVIATEIDTRVVTRPGALVESLVEAESHLRGIEAAIADPCLAAALVAAGEPRHVVQRAAHRAAAMQERRGSADQLDAIVDPGVKIGRAACRKRA